MRYSQLFGKTIREAPKGETSANAVLLTRGGFIQKLGAGIYTLLPLGLRVVEKINQIVREEMNAISGQEILMPSLHPKEVWQESGRWESLRGAMYQLRDSSKKDFGLGFTHEEVIVDLAKNYIHSFRDLPMYPYQIQTKFRDEPRPRSGLIRGREFIMKDLYSFNADQKGLDEFYEDCAEAYTKIFNRCGLETVRTKASGGVFTKELTDEFQVLSQAGEDEIIYCPGGDFAENKEITKVKEGKMCDLGHGPLKRAKAIEVGNIFKFGTLYAEKMNLYYTDKNGQRLPVYLGSYGVGITRTMAALVEVYHDKRGIIWPKSVAPYQAHLLVISEEGRVKREAEDVYRKFQKAGIEVIFDDRDESAGVKFADADLIGIPVRLVVSDKTPKGKVEYKERTKEKTEVLSFEEIGKRLSKSSL